MELAGIGGTDGGDLIGGHQGGLHQIHIAVHGDGAVIEPIAVQAQQILHNMRPKTALILDIMDGEHGFDTAQLLLPAGRILQIHGDQRRLPVVAVDHLRHILQPGQQRHHRPAEKGEALAVVIFAVEASALEIALVIHEIPCHALILQGEQAAILVAPAQIHIDVAAKSHFFAPLVADLSVKGQDHRHLVAVFGQGRRQTARHVGKAPCFAKGRGLAGCK